jgi:AsmA-like protein
MKALGWIFALIVLLVVGVVAFVALNSGNLVKRGIEEFGPQYLGVDVRVNEVNLALTEGSAQVKGLHIGNPPGFAGSHLMKLDEIKVVLDTNQISEQLVVMKQITIDGADLAAIAKGQRTNFQALLDKLESAGGTGAESSADSTGREMKFIVEQFSFTNAKASMTSDVLGELQLDLPDIRLKDIGRKGNGVTAAELAQQVLKPIVEAVSKAAVSKGLDIDGVKANVEQKVRDKIDSGLKSLTDKLRRE